jgi:hypothetical protein
MQKFRHECPDLCPRFMMSSLAFDEWQVRLHRAHISNLTLQKMSSVAVMLLLDESS